MINHKKISKLFLLPYPPPYAGPEIIAKEILESETIKNRDDIIYINANIRKSNAKKGHFDLAGILAFINIYFKYIYTFLKIQKIFIYLSSNRVGFLRDSIYILTAWFFGKKIIAQYHGANFHNFYNTRSRIYKKWIKFSLTKLEKLILLGKPISPYFCGIYDGKLEILGNGLNTNKYPCKKIYEKGIFTIFFMGHLIYSKGIYDLMHAYKNLYKKYGKQIRFVFAGENMGFNGKTKDFINNMWIKKFFTHAPSKNKELQKLINEPDKWNTEYLGFISGNKKLETFTKSDILVLPSYTEGFSMACLEAMAVGLPVITTPVGAMPQVVQHKINGLITEIANPEKLAKNIEYFIINRKEVEKIGRYNAQYVRKNFNIEKVSKKLIEILEDNNERV